MTYILFVFLSFFMYMEVKEIYYYQSTITLLPDEVTKIQI